MLNFWQRLGLAALLVLCATIGLTGFQPQGSEVNEAVPLGKLTGRRITAEKVDFAGAAAVGFLDRVICQVPDGERSFALGQAWTEDQIFHHQRLLHGKISYTPRLTEGGEDECRFMIKDVMVEELAVAGIAQPIKHLLLFKGVRDPDQDSFHLGGARDSGCGGGATVRGWYGYLQGEELTAEGLQIDRQPSACAVWTSEQISLGELTGRRHLVIATRPEQVVVRLEHVDGDVARILVEINFHADAWRARPAAAARNLHLLGNFVEDERFGLPDKGLQKRVVEAESNGWNLRVIDWHSASLSVGSRRACSRIRARSAGHPSMAKGNQGHCSSRGIARWCRRAYPLNTLHTCALRHFARLPWRIGRVGGCAGFGAGGCGWAVPPLERCQVFPGYPPIVEDCSGLRARDRAFLDLKSETCNFEEKVFLARFRFGRQPALSLVGSPCLRGHLLLRVHRADESLMKPYLLTALNIVYFSLFAAWSIW